MNYKRQNLFFFSACWWRHTKQKVVGEFRFFFLYLFISFINPWMFVNELNDTAQQHFQSYYNLPVRPAKGGAVVAARIEMHSEMNLNGSPSGKLSVTNVNRLSPRQRRSVGHHYENGRPLSDWLQIKLARISIQTPRPSLLRLLKMAKNCQFNSAVFQLGCICFRILWSPKNYNRLTHMKYVNKVWIAKKNRLKLGRKYAASLKNVCERK